MLIFGSCGFCVDGAESARHGSERSMCVFGILNVCVIVKLAVLKEAVKLRVLKKKKEREVNWMTVEEQLEIRLLLYIGHKHTQMFLLSA